VFGCAIASSYMNLIETKPSANETQPKSLSLHE
jgi:hypothetical protein